MNQVAISQEEFEKFEEFIELDEEFEEFTEKQEEFYDYIEGKNKETRNPDPCYVMIGGERHDKFFNISYNVDTSFTITPILYTPILEDWNMDVNIPKIFSKSEFRKFGETMLEHHRVLNNDDCYSLSDPPKYWKSDARCIECIYAVHIITKKESSEKQKIQNNIFKTEKKLKDDRRKVKNINNQIENLKSNIDDINGNSDKGFLGLFPKEDPELTLFKSDLKKMQKARKKKLKAIATIEDNIAELEEKLWNIQNKENIVSHDLGQYMNRIRNQYFTGQ